MAGVSARYMISFSDNTRLRPIVIDVAGSKCDIRLGQESGCDVTLTSDQHTFEDILGGRMTFQRAFMAGNMKMKGDFKILRTLDELFVFMN